jgi:thiamine pyrophosphokinase
MTGLLVCGGEAPPRSRLEHRFSDFDRICAADSGLDTLIAWGLEPDMIVGDMDSISDPTIIKRFPRATISISPRDKDKTDTELGLEALSAVGVDTIVLAGGGGGRLDHLLAIRALFERPSPRPSEWYTASAAVYLLKEGEQRCFSTRPGGTVSLFPLAAGASEMHSEGLTWPIDGLHWGPGDFGVSNRADSGQFSVCAGRGDLLVVLEFA